MIFPALWLWQEQTASSSSLADLIFRASPVAQLVLLVLLIFSIISWAIIIAKAVSTKKAVRESAEFLRVKRQEWVRYHSTVGRWEVDQYLTLF